MSGRVVENSAQHRFELAIDADNAALAYYRLDGDRVVLTHTEVPQEFAGRGIGSKLAQGVFDILRETGRKAVVRCPFLRDWLARHPGYNDIVVG